MTNYLIREKDGEYELVIINADTTWVSSNKQDLIDLAEKCSHKNPATSEDDYKQYKWFLANKNDNIKIGRKFYS